MQPTISRQATRHLATASVLLRGAVAAVLLCSSALASPDSVTPRRASAVQAAYAVAEPFARSARAMFLVQVALDEVLNFIDGGRTSVLLSTPPSPVRTSREAAAASAVHTILVALYPDEADALHVRLQRAVDTIPDTAEKESGMILGKALAMTVHALLGDALRGMDAVDAYLAARR